MQEAKICYARVEGCQFCYNVKMRRKRKKDQGTAGKARNMEGEKSIYMPMYKGWVGNVL
jgi:hypothetical protein